MIDLFEEITYELTFEELKQADEVAELLQDGQYHKSTEIMNHLGLVLKGFNPGARIRKIIHYLRVTGKVKLLCASSKGYYICKNKDKIRKYIHSLEQRERSIYRVRHALKCQLEELEC
jgi:hypothetical protein